MSTWSEENERLRMELRDAKRKYRDAAEEREAYASQLGDARISINSAIDTLNNVLERIQPLIFSSKITAGNITVTSVAPAAPQHREPGSLIRVKGFEHLTLDEPVIAYQTSTLAWRRLDEEEWPDYDSVALSAQITDWDNLTLTEA